MTPFEMLVVHWPALVAEAIVLGVIGTALIALDEWVGR